MRWPRLALAVLTLLIACTIVCHAQVPVSHSFCATDQACSWGALNTFSAGISLPSLSDGCLTVSSGLVGSQTCSSGGLISSVFGRTGVITAQSADYSAYYLSLGGGTLTSTLNGTVFAASTTITSPQFCIGLSCITAWPASSAPAGTNSLQYSNSSGSVLLALPNASAGSWLASTTATTAPAMQTKWSIDVRDYGVTGNGTTDDTAAMQAAINAACPAGAVGTTLIIPQHFNIKITSPLVFYGCEGFTLDGGQSQGQTTSFTSTANAYIYADASMSEALFINRTRDSTFKNFSVWTGGYAAAQIGILIDETTGSGITSNNQFEDISISLGGSNNAITAVSVCPTAPGNCETQVFTRMIIQGNGLGTGISFGPGGEGFGSAIHGGEFTGLGNYGYPSTAAIVVSGDVGWVDIDGAGGLMGENFTDLLALGGNVHYHNWRSECLVLDSGNGCNSIVLGSTSSQGPNIALIENNVFSGLEPPSTTISIVNPGTATSLILRNNTWDAVTGITALGGSGYAAQYLDSEDNILPPGSCPGAAGNYASFKSSHDRSATGVACWPTADYRVENGYSGGITDPGGFVGPVTGNVIGNVTGNVTGNAAGTAATLANTPMPCTAGFATGIFSNGNAIGCANPLPGLGSPNVNAINVGTGTTHGSMSLGINVGDYVVVFVNDNSATTPTITDNGSTSNTYIQVGSYGSNFGNGWAFVCEGAAYAATTISVNQNTYSMAGATFINVNGVGAVHSDNTGATSNSVTTTANYSLVVAGFQGPFTSYSPTSGNLVASILTGVVKQAILTQVVPVSGTVAVSSGSGGGGESWAIELKNSALIPYAATNSVVAGQAACIKSTGSPGLPVVIGYCSTVVSSSGSCTCN